jgi:hypothetical protein
MGLGMAQADRPARFYPEVVRVSLVLVVGIWLARQLAWLIVDRHCADLRGPRRVVTVRPTRERWPDHDYR